MQNIGHAPIQNQKFSPFVSNFFNSRANKHTYLIRHFKSYFTIALQGTRDFIRRHITDDLTRHMEMLCLGLDRNSDKLQAQEETMKKQQSSLEDNENKVC